MFKQLSVTLLLGMFLTGCATAQSGDKPVIKESVTTTLTTTVEAVDMKNRTVTLKGKDGKSVTINVSDEVKNLPQVEVGDQVKIEYYEALAATVLPADSTDQTASAGAVMATAEPGQKPAAAVLNEVTIATTIEAIDKTNQTVTLKGPQGNTKTIKVRNPSNLDNVVVGDQVIITYTESLAIAVEEIK